jgi:hypothetical protein
MDQWSKLPIHNLLGKGFVPLNSHTPISPILSYFAAPPSELLEKIWSEKELYNF